MREVKREPITNSLQSLLYVIICHKLWASQIAGLQPPHTCPLAQWCGCVVRSRSPLTLCYLTSHHALSHLCLLLYQSARREVRRDKRLVRTRVFYNNNHTQCKMWQMNFYLLTCASHHLIASLGGAIISLLGGTPFSLSRFHTMVSLRPIVSSRSCIDVHTWQDVS